MANTAALPVKLTAVGPGVQRIAGLPYVIHGIETDVVSDHVLHLF